MSFEPKPLQKRSIEKPFTSPDRIKPSTGASTSPRYRSPIHTRVHPENPELPACPTCEKRSSENPSVQFHESPPKVRPSHHNIVCEDCSEGSFSQVLKVVCLNQELPTGTQKIKIIESTPQLVTSSSFPIIGTGKSMQVMYQEVYPPPKTELTSLIPESCRENGTLNYQMKEEERKRVAIRRAEYANRIKGVTKTIVTTILGNGENVNRRHGMSVDLERGETLDKDEVLCRSEKKKGKIEEGAGDFKDFSFNGKGFEDKSGCFGGIKVESDEFQGEGKRMIGMNGENIKGAGKKEQEKQVDINRVSYFKKIHQQATKDSGENSKCSVKHKILAKLAGKDFAHLLEQEEIVDKKEQEAELSDNDSVFEAEENTDHFQVPDHQDEYTLEQNEESGLGDSHYVHVGSKQNSDRIFDKTQKSGDNTKQSFGITEEENKKYSDSPASFGRTIRSGANTDRSQENHDLPNQVPDTLNEFIKTSKFLESFELDSQPIENNEIEEVVLNQHKRPFGDILKGESKEQWPAYEQEITIELNPLGENGQSLENLTFVSVPTAIFSELKDSQFSMAQVEKVDSEDGTEKFPNSDETRQMSPAGPQEFQETPSKDQKTQESGVKVNKDSEKLKEHEEKITPEQFNKLFFVLTDPKVLKGLRLLGGFADYLEKNGKDVLDWKV